MAKKGKRITGAYEEIDREAAYGLDDAVKMLKEKAKAERVNRGMEKIYALIDRGLNNVTSNG